jgi:hypothetical protein
LIIFVLLVFAIPLTYCNNWFFCTSN